MKTQKNVRKLGNLLIREPSARKKEVQVEKRVTVSAEVKTKRPEPKLDLNREMIEAENLNQQELKEISREASRMMGRKVKQMESKVQEGLVGMLEQECSKLGEEVQRGRAEVFALTNENIQLRRSVQVLSKRLNQHNKQNNQLVQDNDNADIKIQQAKDQIQRTKLVMKRREEELLSKLSASDLKYQKVSKELQEKREEMLEKEGEMSQLRTEVEELIQQLEHYRGEGQKLKETSDYKMKQFNKMRQEIESRHKLDVERRNEKLVRSQMQAQQLEQKFKEEETLRKKVMEKCRELQKELSRKTENIKELNVQAGMNKKRINDLNILKSSNKTILDEKISKLAEENQKLRKEVAKLKRAKSGDQEQEVSCKPYLFGPDDQD